MAKKKASKKTQICIVTVTGKDRIGIVAELTAAMAKADINIVDISQKIMEKYFVMIMAVDIARANIGMEQIHKRLNKIGSDMRLNITFQDENIFKMMHRV